MRERREDVLKKSKVLGKWERLRVSGDTTCVSGRVTVLKINNSINGNINLWVKTEEVMIEF